MKNKLYAIACSLFLIAFASCGGGENSADATKSDSTKNAQEIKTYNPAEGMKEGENEIKYPNGQLKMKGRVLDGKRHGIWTTWRENGLKWSENTYILGALEGKTVSFYPNGQIHYIGYYSNNVKSGKWVFFDETGAIIKEEEYTKK